MPAVPAASSAQIDPASAVTVLRWRRNGERFELPVWTARYEAWLPKRKVTTSGATEDEDAHKGRGAKKGRGKRRDACSDDDEDNNQSTTQFPHAIISDVELSTIIVDQRHVIFSNCFKRDVAPRKSLRDAFGIEDLRAIARVLLAVAEPVETDGVRVARHKESKKGWDTILTHVADGGMLVHIFSGVPPDAREVRMALEKRGAALGDAVALDERVFDDPHIEVTINPSTNHQSGAAAEIFATTMLLLKLGSPEWLAAALVASKLAGESSSAVPVIPDCYRRCSSAAIVLRAAIGRGDDQSPSSAPTNALRLAANTLLAAIDCLVWEPPATEAAVATDGGASLTLQVIIDAAFAAHPGAADAMFASLLHSAGVEATLSNVTALELPGQAQLMQRFSWRHFDVAASLAFFAASPPAMPGVPGAVSTPPALSSVAPGGRAPSMADGSAAKSKVKGSTKESLENMTHAELQALCKRRGLGVGGKKKDMIERLSSGAADESD